MKSSYECESVAWRQWKGDYEEKQLGRDGHYRNTVLLNVSPVPEVQWAEHIASISLHSFNFPSLLQHLDYIYIESSAAVVSAHAYRKMSVSFRKADLVATGLLPPQQHMEPAACTLPVYTFVVLLWWPRLISMVPVVSLIQLIAGVHWHIVLLGILVCACRIECPAAHITHLLSQPGACFGSSRAGPYSLSDPPKKHHGILCEQQLTNLWLAAS